MSKLSVITVNYNSWEPLAALIQTLLCQTQTELELVVVDNASHDPQPDDFFRPAADSHITIKHIKNTTNTGFANACNQGAEAATGEYLLFCNPDVEISPNGLQELLSVYRNHDVQLLTCAQQNSRLKNNPVDGVFPRLARFTPIIGGLFKAPRRQPQHQGHIKLTDWISGAVILIAQTAYQQLKGWDQRFFMYMEDVDLCRRAKDLGMKVGVAEHITWTHHHGLSSKPFPVDRIRSKTSAIVSKHLYANKHFSSFSKPLAHTFIFTKYAPELLLGSLMSILIPNSELKLRRGILNRYVRFMFKRPWV